MRMWMVPTKYMCRKHLLGEHVEIHMFLGSLLKGTDLTGYVDNNLLEFSALQKRHDQIAAELHLRGYRHASPILVPEFEVSDYVANSKVNVAMSCEDLFKRCSLCRRRYDLDLENIPIPII